MLAVPFADHYIIVLHSLHAFFCNIEYLVPAKLEDKLKIHSSIESFNKASFVIIQNIKKDDNLIVKAKLKLVTVNQEGKPIKIPSVLEKKLAIS